MAKNERFLKQFYESSARNEAVICSEQAGQPLGGSVSPPRRERFVPLGVTRRSLWGNKTFPWEERSVPMGGPPKKCHRNMSHLPSECPLGDTQNTSGT